MRDANILLIGASGSIGREVVRILSASGVALRILIRQESESKFDQSLDLDIVRADFRNTESLAPAFDKIDTVYIISRDNPDLASVEIGLMTQAKRAGVTKIVKSSAFAAGLSPPVGYGIPHLEAENFLRESGLDWVILRPYMFMQNFLELADLIRSPGLLPLPMGKAKIGLVDARDVALVASKVLTESQFNNQIYELTGPELLSIDDCAEVFSSLLKHKVKHISPPMWLAGVLMRFQGASAWDVTMRKALFTMIHEGGEAQLTDGVEKISGNSARSLSQFVQENRQSFT